MEATLIGLAVIGFFVFIGMSETIDKFLRNRALTQRIIAIEEHKTRRIEAMARMDEPARERLLETMPDWLDQDDVDDVDAWKKARAETIKIGR